MDEAVDEAVDEAADEAAEEAVEAAACGAVDDIVRKRGAAGPLGRITRTFDGIFTGRESEDPDGLNPDVDEVQVAWMGGVSENVRRGKLELEDRIMHVGDLVTASGRGCGVVVDCGQVFDVEAPGALTGAHAPVALATDVSRSRAVLGHAADVQPLHALVQRAPVVLLGEWLGLCESVKLDYVVRLDSGHEFVLEDNMAGVNAAPATGFFNEGRSLYPGQLLQICGEWLANFVRQTAHEIPPPLQTTLGSGRVHDFSVRSARISWIAFGRSGTDEVRPVRPESIQDPRMLRVCPPAHFVLGDFVYVRPSGSLAYELGVVSKLRSHYTVLWADGTVVIATPGRLLARRVAANREDATSPEFFHLPFSHVARRADVAWGAAPPAEPRRRGGGARLDAEESSGQRRLNLLSELELARKRCIPVVTATVARVPHCRSCNGQPTGRNARHAGQFTGDNSRISTEIPATVELDDSLHEGLTTRARRVAWAYLAELHVAAIAARVGPPTDAAELQAFDRSAPAWRRIPTLSAPRPAGEAAAEPKPNPTTNPASTPVSLDKAELQLGIVLANEPNDEAPQRVRVQWVRNLSALSEFLRERRRHRDAPMGWPLSDGPFCGSRLEEALEYKTQLEEFLTPEEVMAADELVPHPTLACFPGDYGVLKDADCVADGGAALQVLETCLGAVFARTLGGRVDIFAPNEVFWIDVSSRVYQEMSTDESDSDYTEEEMDNRVQNGYSEDDEMTAASYDSTASD